MTEAPLHAELLLDRDAPDDLRRDLVSALEGLGVHPARVRRAVDHRGAADIPWIMLASLLLQALARFSVGRCTTTKSRAADAPNWTKRPADPPGIEGDGVGPQADLSDAE